MKKLLRLIVIAAAINAVLLAALIVLWADMTSDRTETVVFADRSVTEIVSVEIENQNGAVIVKAQDGGYLIEGVPAELIDIEAFIAFMTACSEVAPSASVDRGSRSVAEYGLDAPLAVISVTYADGEKLLLRIGDPEPLSGDYYCARWEENEVWLLPKETAEQYLIAAESLISFAVVPESELSSAFSALLDVTVSGRAWEEPIHIEAVSGGNETVKMLARSFGSATHIVRSAGVYELDQTYGLEVLSPICGLSGSAIVYYGLSEEQEDAMGFIDPYLQLDFQYRATPTGETEAYCVRFLPAAEDGSIFYVNRKGSGTVYLVERQPFFDLQYEKLLLRWFVSPLMMDVTGITVQNGTETVEFALDHSDLKNPVITRNGATMDTELFRDFFRLCCSAAHDGTYLGVRTLKEDAEPVMTVTYHYSDGKPDDVLTLVAGDTRRVDVYVNGISEFAMRDAFVERMQDALIAMENGQSFDTNW